jgi:hypothetical protein
VILVLLQPLLLLLLPLLLLLLLPFLLPLLLLPLLLLLPQGVQCVHMVHGILGRAGCVPRVNQQ